MKIFETEYVNKAYILWHNKEVFLIFLIVFIKATQLVYIFKIIIPIECNTVSV